MSEVLTIMGYLLGIIAFLMLLSMHNHYRTVEDERLDNLPFINPWAIRLYRWSFYAPFIWFIDDTEQEDQSINTFNELQSANLQHLFTYRTWMSFRLIIFSISVFVAGTIYFFMTHVNYVESLLGVKMVQQEVGVDSLLLLVIIAMFISLMPNLFLKFRKKQYDSLYLNDIPIIQTFIILMLKSDKPVTEVLYALTKIETRYQDAFILGYRKYIRNRDEGLDYLENIFKGTAFRETINVLRELGSYSRKDSINILENNKKQIVEVSNQKKRQKDLTKLVFTQALVAIPFIAVLLLALLPLVQYGFEIFNNAGALYGEGFED